MPYIIFDLTHSYLLRSFHSHARIFEHDKLQLFQVNAAVCIACQKFLLDAGIKSDPLDRCDLRASVTLLPLHGIAWFLAVVALEDRLSIALDCVSAIATAAVVSPYYLYNCL